MKEVIASTLNASEVKEANSHMAEWLSDDSGADGQVKAAASLTDYIRVRVREGSIARNILTPQQITAADLHASTTDDDPRFIGEMEIETPGGIVQTLGGNAKAHYFAGKRYEARFNRLMTPRFMKDTAQLLTYKTDYRQMLSDGALKDLLAVEDCRFFQAINNMLAPAASAAGTNLVAGEVVPLTGIKQWRKLTAGVSIDSLNDALSIMTNSSFGLRPATVVVNLNFAYQLQKINRNDFGGDLAQEVKQKGWTEREFLGARWLVTIKNWLVPNGTMYMFAPQEFIGKSLVLEDTTMHVKKDAFMVSFYAYENIAQIIGNIAGVCRCDLNVTDPTEAS